MTDKIIEILKGFAVSPLIGDDIDYRNQIAEEINQLLSTPPTEDKVFYGPPCPECGDKYTVVERGIWQCEVCGHEFERE